VGTSKSGLGTISLQGCSTLSEASAAGAQEEEEEEEEQEKEKKKKPNYASTLKIKRKLFLK
jgi:hypothetical protein